MGKKSLVAGIILISFSILVVIRTSAPDMSDGFRYIMGFLPAFVLFSLPSLVIGIILIVKYFRSRKKEEQFIDSQNNQDNSKKYEPKTNDETQFWVCPVCGKDTRELDGKSYCDNCQRYL